MLLGLTYRLTVTLVLLTGGERGNPKGASDPTLEAIRHREAERAAGILGVSGLIQEDFGDGQLRDRIEEVTAYLSRAITQINPDLIVTYDLAGLDGHQDQVACSENCCRDPGAGTWPSAPPPGGSRPSSEPIRLYEECRSLLARELGVEPRRDVEELVEELPAELIGALKPGLHQAADASRVCRDTASVNSIMRPRRTRGVTVP